MTIDEAIANEREKAKEQRQHIGTWDEEYSKRCEECAEEHEQLAEWLEELKDYRDKNKMVVKIDCVNSEEFKDMAAKLAKGQYNKAIDDFVKACKENIMYKTFGLRECDIEQIAEQLEEGDNND